MQKIILLFLVLGTTLISAEPKEIDKEQEDYERTINAVVRNKEFYKAGRLELAAMAGAMPYDSLINHYSLGGRAVWHFSDHLGWEVLDAHWVFPSVTGYTTDLVSSQTLNNLETVQIKTLIATNFLISPFYGKIRFFGSSVMHFDLFTYLGFGMANDQSLAVNHATGIRTLKTGWDPMFDFGLGVKLYLSKSVGILIDFRDYVIYAETYGRKAFKSNFTVFAGVNFFLPTFG